MNINGKIWDDNMDTMVYGILGMYIYIYNSSMMIRLYLKKTGCTHRSWQSFRQLLAISCKQINAPNLKSSTLCMYLPSGKLT